MKVQRKIAVILNGISFQKKLFYNKFLPALRCAHQVDVFETKSRNDGILLSTRATEKFRYDVILAAGGDGTLHQVVNGVIGGHENESNLPVIGIIPIGSGNDFAKTAGASKDPAQLIALLENFQPKPIDIGKIRYWDFSQNESERYFVNVADIGMGPEVVRRVLDSDRLFGSEASYLKSILATFFSYRPMIVKAVANSWDWQGKVRSLAIANGRFYGHGLCVAPNARPDDELFTAFICGNVSVFDFIRYSGTLKKCKYVDHPGVFYRECTSIALTSEGPCLIEGDGEILGNLPASIELVQRKLDFLI